MNELNHFLNNTNCRADKSLETWLQSYYLRRFYTKLNYEYYSLPHRNLNYICMVDPYYEKIKMMWLK